MKITQSMNDVFDGHVKKPVQLDAYDEYAYPTAAGQEVIPSPHVKVIHETVVIHKTEKVEAKEPARPDTLRFYLSEDTIFKEHDDKKKRGRKLAPSVVQLLRLLIEADHQNVPAAIFKKKIDPINQETFKSQIVRLKKWGRKNGCMATDIIEGKSGHGYRIPKGISIQMTGSK